MRALSSLHVSLKFQAYADPEVDYESAELIASFVNPETGQRIQVSDCFTLEAAESWLRAALAECIRVRLAKKAVRP